MSTRMCITELDFRDLQCRVAYEAECVAYNEYYEAWLSAEDGETTLSIMESGEPIYELPVYCWEDVETLIGEYFGDEEKEEQQWEIERSEEIFDEAVEYFISSIVEDEVINPEVIQDCKDHFLEYMYRKFGLTIRRPMILEDEDGEDFFEEYPYECMVFEDAPLYS